MGYTFTITVFDDDYDSSLGGWRCSALRLPGSTLQELRADGVVQDSSYWRAVPELGLVKWSREVRPMQAVLVLRVADDLAPASQAIRLKRLAIVAPVVATIVTALITAGTTWAVSSSKGYDVTTNDKGGSATAGRGASSDLVVACQRATQDVEAEMLDYANLEEAKSGIKGVLVSCKPLLRALSIERGKP